MQRFKETGHPVFTGASALSRGILRKLKGKETIHFYADALNTEVLFRIIHSCHSAQYLWSRVRSEGWRKRTKFADKANSVNKEILKSVISQEVKSLVCAPRRKPASGNGLRESLQNFGSLSRTVKFTKICELAPFWHMVEIGM